MKIKKKKKPKTTFTTVAMGCISGFRHLLFITSALLTGLVSYYMYQNIPDDIENPWLVRAWLGSRQFIQDVSLIGEKFGANDRLEISRKIYNSIDRYKMTHEPKNLNLKITNTLFGETRVRFYEPIKQLKSQKRPAILYFHGGGWTQGGIDSAHTICRELADKSKIVVVAVSFSFAPESPYPQALDDCEAATRYFMDNAQRYGVDSSRIALAGDGTGANMAAALTLRSRDRSWTNQPKLQILLYPILQMFDFNTPSYTQNRRLLVPLNNPIQIAKNFLLYLNQNPNIAKALLVNNHTSVDDRKRYKNLISHELLPEKFTENYQPKESDIFDQKIADALGKYVLHPYVSPLMYGNGKLHKIAKAYIATMHYDSVRDDGMIYARQIRQSKGKAVLKHYQTGYHDCLKLLGYSPLADIVINDLVHFVTRDL